MMTPEEMELEIKCLHQQILNLQDMFCNHIHEGTTNKPLIIRDKLLNKTNEMKK